MRSALAFLFIATLNAGAQDSEAGIIKVNYSQRLLRIESDRPLDSAAFLLAEAYHLHVNTEAPPFACPEDVIDTQPSQHFALAGEHAYWPKGGAFEVRYSVDAQRKPVNVAGLMRQIILVYNQGFHSNTGCKSMATFLALCPFTAAMGGASKFHLLPY